jgi:hypothetical protein
MVFPGASQERSDQPVLSLPGLATLGQSMSTFGQALVSAECVRTISSRSKQGCS